LEIVGGHEAFVEGLKNIIGGKNVGVKKIILGQTTDLGKENINFAGLECRSGQIPKFF